MAISEYVWAVLGVVAVIYIGLGALVFLVQNRLLYFPHRYSLQEAEGRARGLDLTFWPDRSRDYYGFIDNVGPHQPEGVILLFHGNAGSALDRTYYISQLEHLGYRVILCEYPGFGARPGNRRQRDLVASGIEAARAGSVQFRRPLILMGESLGCGVASAVAASGQVQVQAVLLITPWDTLPDLAQRLYWFFPARLFTRDTYNNIRNLQGYAGTVGVVMAEKDEIIPCQNTQRLFDALACDKQMWALPGVGHNTWPSAVDENWWRRVMGFLTSQPQPPPSPLSLATAKQQESL